MDEAQTTETAAGNGPDQDNDLIAMLEKRTAPKTPGTQATGGASKFWEASDDDFEEEEPAPEPEPAAVKSKDTVPQAELKSPARMDVISRTDKDFQQSAENTVFMIETGTEMFGKIVLNRKLKKRLTEHEKERLRDGVSDNDISTLSKEDKAIREKYDRLLEKKEEKSAKLPFDKDEREIMEDAYFRLYKQRNIEMPPEVAVIISTFVGVGSRMTDIFID